MIKCIICGTKITEKADSQWGDGRLITVKCEGCGSSIMTLVTVEQMQTMTVWEAIRANIQV